MPLKFHWNTLTHTHTHTPLPTHTHRKLDCSYVVCLALFWHLHCVFRRTYGDVLELEESSLDMMLTGSRIRYRLQDTPIVGGVSVSETHTHVIVLVTTVASVHRLIFPHPCRRAHMVGSLWLHCGISKCCGFVSKEQDRTKRGWGFFFFLSFFVLSQVSNFGPNIRGRTCLALLFFSFSFNKIWDLTCKQFCWTVELQICQVDIRVRFWIFVNSEEEFIYLWKCCLILYIDQLSLCFDICWRKKDPRKCWLVL